MEALLTETGSFITPLAASSGGTCTNRTSQPPSTQNKNYASNSRQLPRDVTVERGKGRNHPLYLEKTVIFSVKEMILGNTLYAGIFIGPK